MSIAGIRSNRGDAYQTLVAFDWALTVLSDQDFQWLEIDSVTYTVDDVVISKADGTLIACQCKKNQTHFKAWSISDLADELEKACKLLANNQIVTVRFYSRSNFGAVAKLKEHSTTQSSEFGYKASLGQEHQAVHASLSALLATFSTELSVFEFLRRTSFITSDDLDRMEDMLRERLRSMVSNPESAFAAIWASLDRLGARINDSAFAATQHRLTKDDLKSLLVKSGALLVPPMNLEDILHSFSSTSAIGRSWRRDIAGQRFSTCVLDELLASIFSHKRSILLTGLPGSGKTCIMLALQEALEKRAQTNSDIVSLFIQAREFSDLTASEDRSAQGLSVKWVEQAARLAEKVHVIVLIDSLDVLSIARDHRVLQYFLAQIDRLLMIPNVTVVAACREFDRQYDRRIAERKWSCELKSTPLDWFSEIVPLLESLEISTDTIDTATRLLIKNPRELALFVELAQRHGSFNVVTSQALAQRYLDTIVRSNDTLGDVAVQAIESVALEMLKVRSLVIPHQRFRASQEIRRKLCSLNVLQETTDGNIIFGHQTLLDVLVISGALRDNVTLSEFIQALPPVPFVRPSIRSFVAQLALGERREFRRQLRPVLMGTSAFHIRRLVAESFAEQLPHDEDWPLIRDLRNRHRDVFQVIYGLAGAIEWHHFWQKHLVPSLRSAQDAEGLKVHAHRVAQWSGTDCEGVLALWMEVLSTEWLDGTEIADRLGIHLHAIKLEHLALVVPLLQRLLDMPQTEHSFLGRVIANCVQAGVIEDSVLWRYVSGGVSDEDALLFRLDNKLRCQMYEFGDGNQKFLSTRILQSTDLLSLVIESIEHWSNVRASRYGNTRIGYRSGFLNETSYQHSHSCSDFSHPGNLDSLLDAVEEAILHHAKNNTAWWNSNRDRLCFSHEGALLYFAILACTAFPSANVQVAGRMLCDQNMLEFELSYELGVMIQAVFVLLDLHIQDLVMANIMNIWAEQDAEASALWVLKYRAELILAIPCHLRPPELQALVDIYEKQEGAIIRQPSVNSFVGMVRPPFSFDVFLASTDSGVLRLLSHYDGHSDWGGSDFLIGGEREVGWQLQEAASRNPSRFLGALSLNWSLIPQIFRDDIMDGATNYLLRRYGNLQKNEVWQPVEEPQPGVLKCQIFDVLEQHPTEWRHRRSTAKALEACANVLDSPEDAMRLVALAEDFLGLHEADPIEGNSVGLIELGLNMAKGDVADALMILACKFAERDYPLPESLVSVLNRFACDEQAAVRAIILRRLPYLQKVCFNWGWELFHLAIQGGNNLWKIAEPCLYYAYHHNFEIVRPVLERLRAEGHGERLEVWGRISALATLTNHISFSELLENLSSLESEDAWRGAATVWTHHENIKKHRDQCLSGVSMGLNLGGAQALAVAEQMAHIFDGRVEAILVPIELVELVFSVFKSDDEREKKQHRFFGFHEWLNTIVQHEPDLALAGTEIYLAYVSPGSFYLYDHKNCLTQLMTRLFAEAEEREEYDCSAMLRRVVVIQDTLLSLGVNGVDDWLKAAERP